MIDLKTADMATMTHEIESLQDKMQNSIEIAQEYATILQRQNMITELLRKEQKLVSEAVTKMLKAATAEKRETIRTVYIQKMDKLQAKRRDLEPKQTAALLESRNLIDRTIENLGEILQEAKDAAKTSLVARAPDEIVGVPA